MFAHIGDSVIIKTKDIIGIFDTKTINESRENKKIQFEMKEKNLDGDSIILMEKSDKISIIPSRISVATLKKRVEKGIF